jgi:ankyrin repeat protein
MSDQPTEGSLSLEELLAAAARDGRVDRVQELIRAGANVNALVCDTPVIGYTHDEKTLEVLIQNGADVNLKNREGETCLHWAVFDDLDDVVMLLRHGADPNVRDDRGEPPLFWAQNLRTVDIAKVLLANGADPNLQRPEDGWTALRSAIIGGEYEMAQALLRSGADVEIRDHRGDTPLMSAAEMYGVYESDIVGLLLEYGADINARNWRDGMQAIHCACYHGANELVRRLVQAGAEINSQTAGGMTPLDVASVRGHHSTVQLLRDLGGRGSGTVGGCSDFSE